MHDLGEALIDAISESSEINDSLKELQQAGYSLYLVVDSKGANGKRGQSREARVKKAVAEAEARAGTDPSFRIDGKDLLFLRSIGIDPTRKSRNKRG